MTTTRVYKSTDAGAPVLTGAVSSLINVLDACLVTGYNTKTITITRSGDVATAACTSHGFLAGQYVTISGATPSDYNGEFRVASVTANDFTFEVLGSPTTPATGTISCVQSPAGWTKPYTGTNKAAFRNSVSAGGTGMYLRVNDSASGTGGAREALVRCYLTMSDVDTGTVETPTVAQVAASIVWRKSNTVDSTARAWILVADELTMYLCVSTGTLNSNVGDSTYGAGDIASHVAGDAYRFFVAGREAQATTHFGSGSFGLMTPAAMSFAAPSASACSWLARGYAGTGSPVRIGLATFGLVNDGVAIGTSAAIARPSPGSSLSYFYPAFIGIESSIRGQMRGLYVPQNNWGGVDAGFEVVNPPGLAGTLMALRHNINPITYSTINDAHIFVDITNAWPT